MRIDTRNTLTIHASGDDIAALAERIDNTSETGRILAEAAPSEHPLVELRESEPDEDGVTTTLDPVVFAYAITIPPVDVDRVRAALAAEGHDDAAAALGT